MAFAKPRSSKQSAKAPRGNTKIVFMRDSFLSNYFPCEIDYLGQTFPSVQHAFQAAKSMDPTQRASFAGNGVTGERAKAMGKSLKLRADWEQPGPDGQPVKFGVMKSLLVQKFTVHADLRDQLLATGTAELVKGTTCGETFWGKNGAGDGENHLGRLIMEVRSELMGG